jgi:hypothetical protein
MECRGRSGSIGREGACGSRHTSATRPSPIRHTMRPPHSRGRTLWRCPNRTQSATKTGAVYPNSRPMPTGSRSMATKYRNSTQKNPANPYAMSKGRSPGVSRSRRGPGVSSPDNASRPRAAPPARSAVSWGGSTPAWRTSLDTVPLPANSALALTIITAPNSGRMRTAVHTAMEPMALLPHCHGVRGIPTRPDPDGSVTPGPVRRPAVRASSTAESASFVTTRELYATNRKSTPFKPDGYYDTKPQRFRWPEQSSIGGCPKSSHRPLP